MWLRGPGSPIVNKDRDRLGRVAGRFQHLQADGPEFEDVAIVKCPERICRFGRGAQADRRADTIAQLEMSSDEIGMQMGQKHVLDLQRMLGGERDVMIRIALRVNNGSRAGLLVSNHVRRVRQAWQIELLEDQAAPTSLSDYGVG